MTWARVKWSEAGQIIAQLDGDAARDGGGMTPSDYFAQLVAAGRLEDAVQFLALALPRFETVAWAAYAVRDMTDADKAGQKEAAALKAALLWLQDPVEARRRAAYEAAGTAQPNSAERMAAMAVFYSGGSIAPPDCQPLPAPHDAAGRFAAGAILLAAARAPDMDVALRKALASGETRATGAEVR